jgi:O-antigen ligase
MARFTFSRLRQQYMADADGAPAPSRARRRALLLTLLITPVLAVAIAYLGFIGWQPIAVAIIFGLPALVLIYRHPFLTVLVWLLLMPFLLHTDSTVERYVYWGVHRGLPLLTVGLILLRSSMDQHPRRLPRLGLAEVAMGGYVAVSIASIYLQSHAPVPTAILFYDRIIIAMCLYFIVRLAEPSDKELRGLIPVAVFIVLSQSAIGMIAWIAPGLLPNLWLETVGERTIGSLVNAAVYTIALLFAGLILFQVAMTSAPSMRRRLYILCFLLTLYFTFLSFSRASWIGGLVVGAFLGLLYPRFMTKLAVAMIPLALVGAVVLSSQLDWAKERLTSDEAENSALSRLPIMVGAFNMFREKPFFGWGYNNFDYYDRSFYDRLLDMAHDNKDHASHNYFLSILAEQGGVGLLLYMAPTAVWLAQTARRWRNLPGYGFGSRRMIIMLWLVILFHIIVTNFINMIVVYGLGIWWISLGLIGYLVARAPQPAAVPAAMPGRASVAWLPERSVSR